MTSLAIYEEHDFGIEAGCGIARRAEGERLRPGVAALLMLALSFGLWCGLIATLIAALASP
jgi:hypothetical protein